MSRYYQSSNMMSITRMRRFFAHRGLHVILVVVVGLPMVLYFGAGPLGGYGGSNAHRAMMDQPIVTVNGEPVRRAQYEQQWESLRRMTAGDEVQALNFQGMILGSAIDSAMMRAAARARGLQVSDADIDKAIEEQKKGPDGKKIPDSEWKQRLEMQGITERELRDALRESLLPQVLAKQLADQNKVTEEEFEKSFDRYKVRHILFSTGGKPEEQQKAKAEKVLAELKAGKDFAKLANEYSDDPGNKPMRWDPKAKKSVPAGEPKGGDLGWAPASNYVGEFAEAVRNAKVGEIVGPVKTQYGFHIIKVEGKKRELPKDYAKEKTRLFEEFKRQKEQEATAKFMEAERAKAKIVWHDPSLEWRYLYSKNNPMSGMMTVGATGQDEFEKKLAEYVQKNQTDSAAAIVLGQTLYRKYVMAPPGAERDKLREQVITAYEIGLRGSENQQTRFSLAQLYRDAKQDDKALAHYKTIQRLLRWDDTTASRGAHEQLLKAFIDLGEKELADKERKRIAELEVQAKKEEAERKAKAAKEEAERKAAEAKAKTEAKKTAGKDAAPKTDAPPGPPPTPSVEHTHSRDDGHNH